MKKITLALLLLGLMSGCGNKPEEAAQETTAPSIEADADADAGKVAAAACIGCHGDNGISNLPETPHLAGQPAEYLGSAMLAYQDGSRKHEPMVASVQALSEQDIANIAAHYASMTAPDNTTNPEPVAINTESEESTETVSEAAVAPAAAASCAGCHGPTGVSAIPGTPSLAALSKDYLVTSTTAYKTQDRQDPVMMGMVAALSDEDIADIAEFYAAQPLDNPSTPASGDAAAGEAAAAACAGCHGADGNSGSAANPSLAGQDATYLANAIKAYKANTRNNAVMPGLVAALSDADADNLGAFYAAKARTAPSAGAGEEINREPMAASEWAAKCDRCHGVDGVSDIPGHPRLANQRADYIARALTAYQNGDRESSSMHKMSMPLMESEIMDIANHYSRR